VLLGVVVDSTECSDCIGDVCVGIDLDFIGEFPSLGAN
jgi:protein-arginine kinase